MSTNKKYTNPFANNQSLCGFRGNMVQVFWVSTKERSGKCQGRQPAARAGVPRGHSITARLIHVSIVPACTHLYISFPKCKRQTNQGSGKEVLLTLEDQLKPASQRTSAALHRGTRTTKPSCMVLAQPAREADGICRQHLTVCTSPILVVPQPTSRW